MVHDHSVLLEDSRFEDADVPKKKKLPPQLHWYRAQDYLTDEMLGVFPNELAEYISVAENAYAVLVEATELAIKENRLITFGIPSSYMDLFHYSWNQRKVHPYLYGRMDINGILNKVAGKMIEFNADTCSTLPETMLWQPIQQEILGKGYEHFNYLEESLTLVLKKLFTDLNADYKPAFLGSSMGHPEDVENVNMVLKMATQSGFHSLYSHLEHVLFNEDGIFVESGQEYIPIDVFFKFFPWDWAINEEPELMQLLNNIILENKCVVLNPFYTMLWQNKKFLAFISEKFPSNTSIAKTSLKIPPLESYVTKPAFGRIGENVKIHHSRGLDSRTDGDYGSQQMVYQEFIANPIDKENYTYQAGVFMVGSKAVALNYRCSDKEIINDDCEFFCHFLK